VVRTARELLEVTDPAWPEVQDAVAASPLDVRVPAVAPGAGADVIARLQVSARSTLGALASASGGIVVDHGWLRILGGGNEGLPDLASANGLDVPGPDAQPPPALVVGYDVLGGRFALDAGGLGVQEGEVCYLGPDSLAWVGLGAGHSAFVHWALAGEGLEDFYASLRWPGWEERVAGVALDRGLAVYPPPFTEEGRDLVAASLREVPFAELLSWYDELREQIAGLGEGETFELRPADS
jgi:hypothetical protein